MSIILGVDPGSRVAGYGIVQVQDKTPRYIASGLIRLTADTLSSRLLDLHASIEQLIQTFKPDEAAIEKVFVGKNADSALKLGQARGAALLALAQANLPLSEYSPRTIKHTVTGSGAADKLQVAEMVVQCLSLSQQPAEDAADALAIALCHAYTAPFKRALEKQKQAVD